jgi:hypothetical protein
LFGAGKVPAKHDWGTLCYSSGMELFLIATMTGLLTVVLVDTGQKRRAFLCQQERINKPN